jgi:hypothetical protein
LATIPQSLKQECREAVDIPEGPLSAAQISRGWVADRLSLSECRESKHALISALEAQQGAGHGAGKQ